MSVACQARRPEYLQVESRHGLSAEELHATYVDRRPVAIRGCVAGIPALAWDHQSLDRRIGELAVKVKYTGRDRSARFERMPLRSYLTRIRGAEPLAGEPRFPPYVHDTPILVNRPELISDFAGLPVELLPAWYRELWWKFALFFVGPPGSVTPLHFDTLETHNLFFQLRGRKRFILVPRGSRRACSRRGWRWFDVDAEEPDLERHPDFRSVQPLECTLGPGDALYIPPGWPHQVRGLDSTISFNIDWHTRSSAWRGVSALARGMPLRHAAANVIHVIGLTTGLPSAWLYPLYRRHLASVD